MGNTLRTVSIELKNGDYEGKIKIIRNKIIFHGYGSMKYSDGSRYEGNYKNNQYSGPGTYVDQYRIMFEGWWDNNELKEGQILHGDNIYVGKIKNLAPHGTGKLLFKNKNVYLGNFVKGSISGYGLLYNPINHQCYTGYWEKNKPIGIGSMLIHDEISAKKIKVINGAHKTIVVDTCNNPFSISTALNTTNFDNNNDDKLICNICYDNDKSIMFIPCNHITSCTNCSDKLNKCPICNKKIKKKINFFLT